MSLGLTPSNMEEQLALNDAVRLRQQKRYHESELVLSYLYQDNFEEVLKLVEEFDAGASAVRHAVFKRTVQAYAQMHTELMLTEAVASSEEVWHCWFAGRSLEDYDDLDIHMACLCYSVQELGRRLLGDDEPDIGQTLAEEPIIQLRRHLLATGRVEEVLLVIRAQRNYLPAERIQTLREALESCEKHHPNILSSSLRDVSGWIRLDLAEAFSANDQRSECIDQLNIASKVFHETGNLSGSLWVQLHFIISVEEGGDAVVCRLQDLVVKFKAFEDWKAVQRCMVAIATAYRRNDDHMQYSSALMACLETIAGKSESTPPGEYGRALNKSHARQNKGSMFLFWRDFIDQLEEDVGDHHYFGVAIAGCSRFFALHVHCSIPQQQVLFADVLSRLYECRTGDASMALVWACEASKYATATGIESLVSEMECRVRILISSDSVSIQDDPYGIKTRAIKITDLEFLYGEMGEKGYWVEQISYAQQLLEMQLKAEVHNGVPINGEPWVSRAKAILTRLPENMRAEREHAIDFSIAHATFESGDSEEAIRILTALITRNENEPQKRPSLVSRLHTDILLAHAQLQAYRTTNDSAFWDASHEGLERTRRRFMECSMPDWVACCHCTLADLWRVKGQNPLFMEKALHHLHAARAIWDAERSLASQLQGIEGVLTRYALRHRNESAPGSILRFVYDIYFANGDFQGAWRWAQNAKARAYISSLSRFDEDDISTLLEPTTLMGPGIDVVNFPQLCEHTVWVEWVEGEDAIYMITVRVGEKALMHRLDIDLPTVMTWCATLRDTKDDLRDVDSAADTLAELEALCTPLADPAISAPGEVLILCPTQALFQVPLHALCVDGDVLLSRNPVVYTYALPVLRRCCAARRPKLVAECLDQEQKYREDITLFGNPTGDTPGGTRSVGDLEDSLPPTTTAFTGDQATRENFISACQISRLVHYHGHVMLHDHPLQNEIILADAPLKVRDLAAMNLRQLAPIITMVSCGSGVERFSVGDEPLGLISSFIYAGASSVIATLWPINDTLSGEPFSRAFYSGFSSKNPVPEGNSNGMVNMAICLQKAALQIRQQPETSAPYYWAAFVLHGQWLWGKAM